MPSYSGLYDGVYNTPHTLLSDSVAKGNAARSLSVGFANKAYGRGRVRELLVTLIGAAAGSTATASHTRRKATRNLSENVQGGLITMETFNSVNRATTAADATMLKDALDQSPQPTYVVDKSGNGGGGKLGS